MQTTQSAQSAQEIQRVYTLECYILENKTDGCFYWNYDYAYEKLMTTKHPQRAKYFKTKEDAEKERNTFNKFDQQFWAVVKASQISKIDV
jgi:hypothetical protein